MSLAVAERPAVVAASGSGGAPARRAIVRWSWRLFRREWRQQALVLALVLFAVAATVVGVGLAYNAGQPLDATFGSANSMMTFSGAGHVDVAAARKAFGTIEVIAHRQIAIPGSLDALDVRAQDPNGKYGYPTLRLLSGRYPTGAGDIAMTKDAAATFDLHLGGRIVENGHTRRLVGLVENPVDLHDEFALVEPGQADPPTRVTILFDAPRQRVADFRPSGSATEIGTRSSLNHTAAAAVVLALETIGLLFVGLVAAAGFAVIAQRRLRALGMLGALGATDRHVRLAMVANGAAVGVAGSVTGAVVGAIAWIALAPRFETLVKHRIDRLHLPWWAIATAMLLAVVTAIIAAWWPARTASRGSIVRALSERPSPPKPAHRFAGAGAVFLAAGIGFLAFAHRSTPNAFFIISGTIATTFGMLFLGPLFIRVLASAGRRAPIALRLALRDLARYQARSAAALGAISLALAIASTVVISAAAQAVPTAEANLAPNQAVVYLSSGTGFGVHDGFGIEQHRADEVRSAHARVDAIAAAVHARVVVPMLAAIDPASPNFSPGGPGPSPAGAGSNSVAVRQPGRTSAAAPTGSVALYAPAALAEVTPVASHGHSGIEITHQVLLYVATPALLAHYGIAAGAIDSHADVISGRTDLAGLVVTGPDGGPTPCDASQPRCRVNGKRPTGSPVSRSSYSLHPVVQRLAQLPRYTSAPDTLLTAHGLATLGLKSVTAGWLIQAPAPLTTAQVTSARQVAAAAGVTIETRKGPASYAPLRNGATAIGLLVALGVLAMTVGLIRSETANDLRTLAATGATSTTRRALTGATAGSLALLGALLGTGGAYAALVAWHRSDLHPLARVPFVDLAVIVAGLPAIAVAAGWLLAGREPPAIAHRPLD